MKNIFHTLIIIYIALLLSSCNNTSEPEPGDGNNQGKGISDKDLAFKVGNEWNYEGKGYNLSNDFRVNSICTLKVRITSKTNASGLDGYKLYSSYRDYWGTLNYFEYFASTENQGLWTLENLQSGSTAPIKLLPFGTDSMVMSSDIYVKKIKINNNPPKVGIRYENVQITSVVRYEFMGTEDIVTPAGKFNNCKKIKLTSDIRQRSDTNNTVVFDAKTWHIEDVCWLSENSGLIRSETQFTTMVDSIKKFTIWDPITKAYRYVYYEIVGDFHFASYFKRFGSLDNLFIAVTDPAANFKFNGTNTLKYVGKYIYELASKNF